jgi:hypothetical protein
VRIEPIPSGRSEWASSEEAWILDLLRNAGAGGVSREYLIFTCKSTQCGRAINSLEKRGYVIGHIKLAGEQYVRYVLKGEPLKLRSLSGFPSMRAANHRSESEHGAGLSGLPLFDAVAEK